MAEEVVTLQDMKNILAKFYSNDENTIRYAHNRANTPSTTDPSVANGMVRNVMLLFAGTVYNAGSFELFFAKADGSNAKSVGEYFGDAMANVVTIPIGKQWKDYMRTHLEDTIYNAHWTSPIYQELMEQYDQAANGFQMRRALYNIFSEVVRIREQGSQPTPPTPTTYTVQRIFTTAGASSIQLTSYSPAAAVNTVASIQRGSQYQIVISLASGYLWGDDGSASSNYVETRSNSGAWGTTYVTWSSGTATVTIPSVEANIDIRIHTHGTSPTPTGDSAYVEHTFSGLGSTLPSKLLNKTLSGTPNKIKAEYLSGGTHSGWSVDSITFELQGASWVVTEIISAVSGVTLTPVSGFAVSDVSETQSGTIKLGLCAYTPGDYSSNANFGTDRTYKVTVYSTT